MNRSSIVRIGTAAMVLWLIGSLVLYPSQVNAQSFDFERLSQAIKPYTVVMKIKVEMSFGMQTNEQEQRLLGTMVSDDGVVLFDGTLLATEHQFSSMAGISIKTTPTSLEVTTMDGKKYKAEYIGVDRFTKLGFARITDAGATKFTSVKFVPGQTFRVGSWVSVFMLLPEFVSPPVASDIGMISGILDSPERFPLTVGFSNLQLGSVVFDERLSPVGVLGQLLDPTSANTDANGMIESLNQFDVPLLGIVTAERLQKMISSPPKKGEPDRAWLGITLQALTKDIGGFLNIGNSGGIIVNDVAKNSPADKAGMKIGDVIYQMNGQPIEVDMDEKVPMFQRRIAEMPAGTSVEFGVLRPHDQSVDTLKILAKLEAAPLTALNAPSFECKELEFKVRNMVFGDFAANNIDVGSLSGVVVSELKQGGLSDVGGLEIGDIVQRIGSTTVVSVDDVKGAVGQILTTKPREVIFFLWRNNKTMFVNVKTDWRK
jgi:serine protease Do